MKTHTVKQSEITEQWHLIDASEKPLGRVATEISRLLRGKHRPNYSPHLHLGDYVVVVNADKVHLTGGKQQQKLYYRFSGYPGGLKTRTFQEMMAKDPSRVVRHAVKGMLPSNRLGRRLLKKLKVYSGSTHPHEAQKPAAFSLEI
jgi:large subunit ribosomal protein L13